MILDGKNHSDWKNDSGREKSFWTEKMFLDGKHDTVRKNDSLRKKQFMLKKINPKRAASTVKSVLYFFKY